MIDTDRQALDSAISGLETSAFNFGCRFIPDSMTRLQYSKRVAEFSKELVDLVELEQLSAKDAAKQASEMRNIIMDADRGKTSEIAQAYAFNQKAVGMTLPDLEQKYSKRIYRKHFSQLSPGAKNNVWKEIVFSAGRPQLKATRLAKVFGIAGKGLIAMTITISVYNIATAEDKVKASAKESVVLGGGLLGSVAGGAAAGCACGPGAPICVSIGVFVGGVMFALGTEFAFDIFWR